MNLNYSETVFNQCGQLMTSRISSSMAVMMNNVEEALFDIITNEQGSSECGQYIDAIRILRMKKHEIQVRFKNQFVSLFQLRVRSLVKNRKSSTVAGSKWAHAASLKTKNSVEDKMLQVTVDKIKNDCHSVLLNLDKRISSMLQNIEFDDSANPMQPETVIEAFWESCRDIDIKPEIRQVLVSLFEKHVALDLKYLYEDLDTHISDRLSLQASA